ncbi:MAG: GNAT family N-acetyltransferase [Chloracidobacterium sp.]|nr:GNAT family N-acetyltransferase [Chloracidobacterium sp.]
MKILETERLILREINSAIDAEFIFELLNTPKFLKYIGDRKVRSVEQAREFIEKRYRQSYCDHGYGLYTVELKSDNTPAGVCGFVKRDHFEFGDVGFAFLPAFEGKGYGFESANAVLDFGRDTLGFTKVLAITSQDNDVSDKLLEKLGFHFDRIFSSPDGEDLNLFEKQL